MQQSLEALKRQLSDRGLFALIIPNTDPHQSEYIADYWRVMKFLTGFSGSTGNVVISSDFAGVWTDSRYFLQAESQLKGSGYELVKLKIPHTPEYIDWITEKAPEHAKVGIDARLFSLALYRRMEKRFAKKGIEIVDVGDLISDLWPARPEIPLTPIFIHDQSFAGKSRASKLRELREEMKAKAADYTFISSLDDIAWLYNIRGNDVDYNPTPLCFSLIGLTEATLYINPSKVSDDITEILEQDVKLRPYEEISDSLAKIEGGQSLFLDPGKSNKAALSSISNEVKLLEGMNLTTLPKALKNETEISHIREVMIKDGIAMCKFLMWLESHIGKEKITEVSAAEKLEAFRAEQPNFKGPSFGTIAGYKGNGAIVHYSAEESSCAELHADGIFLLDSGGQYLDGTTDITRTLALSEPKENERRDFTLVLKGHIGIATAVFPAGTRGQQIEASARRALWKYGLNYGHGTGHGVGFFLNVHEGPQTMGSGASGAQGTPMMPGMLTSNEPGIYHSGKYGIRIENLILCVEDQETEFGQFLKFETVTLCPIDLGLVDADLLNREEKDWLNSYHAEVYEKLAPRMNESEKAWLKERTQALS
ncbi:MAG: aminopeptidase P family protein [Bacteroidia bacterium]|nr:aminopeptidase P family protein [Bacteroidia bacterium]